MVETITSATTSLGPDLLAVGGVALVAGIALFGLRKGVGFFKSLFSKAS